MRSRFLTVFFMLTILLLALPACGGGSGSSEQSGGVTSTNTKIEFPIELTDARISAGAGVYEQYCVSCHGPVDGRPIIEAAPPHGDSGHTWHHPDRLLFQWVLDKPPLATSMPAFRGTLSDEQVAEVLAYIKNHWLPEIQQRQREGSVQYEVQVNGLRPE